MVTYFTLITTLKIVRQGTPSYFQTRMELEDEDFMTTRAPRLQITRNSFRCRGVTMWNRIPYDIRTLPTITSFKKNLKRWIIESRQRMDPG